MDGRGCVLLVSAEPAERARLGRWLEAAAPEVMLCPGPGTGPCVGLTERRCPLASAASVVVLQASPPGAPPVPWLDLAEVYAGLGRPVLALLDADPAALSAAGARTVVLPRRPTRAALLDAVRRALSASGGEPLDRGDGSPSAR